jgi:hypothetical protein
LKNGDILWCHYGYLIDYVRCYRIRKDELDLIASSDVLQAAKEAVPMPRNSEVSRLARMRRPNNASHAAVQRKIISALKDRHFKLKLRNAQQGHRGPEHMTQARVVGANPLVAPLAGIDAGGGFPTTRVASAMRGGHSRRCLRERCNDSA